MIPMKTYFEKTFYKEFLDWYHSNPKIKKNETLSAKNVSKRISISESISPSDGFTPQIVITAKHRLIMLVDEFLFEEKHYIAFKEKTELRFNLCIPRENPWL